MVIVVNLRVSPYDVYGGRSSGQHIGLGLGNPFVVGRDAPAGECAEMFGLWFTGTTPAALDMQALALRLLYNRAFDAPLRLGCWCKPANCHCDHIARWINNHIQAAVVPDHQHA